MSPSTLQRKRNGILLENTSILRKKISKATFVNLIFLANWYTWNTRKYSISLRKIKLRDF
jgi:hypothetical protein